MSVMREGKNLADDGTITVIGLAAGTPVPSTAIMRDGIAYSPAGAVYVVYV